MDKINDSPEQARAVARLLGGMLCHVNLIPLNPTSASPYKRTPYPRVKEFERILRREGIPTTLRVEKGIEIAAGCGQLRQQAGQFTWSAGANLALWPSAPPGAPD
jgi:23S rRNA (adenine2503-C2)-methyltransferase